MWNIGAEGQFLAGAMAATAITIYFPHLPMYLSIPCMVVASIAAGTLGLLTAIPRTYFQVNELITSLMLNYVALLALNYAVFGPWKDPKGFNFPGSPMFTAAQSLPTFGASRLHLGIILPLSVCLFMHSSFGIHVGVMNFGLSERMQKRRGMLEFGSLGMC